MSQLFKNRHFIFLFQNPNLRNYIIKNYIKFCSSNNEQTTRTSITNKSFKGTLLFVWKFFIPLFWSMFYQKIRRNFTQEITGDFFFREKKNQSIRPTYLFFRPTFQKVSYYAEKKKSTPLCFTSLHFTSLHSHEEV